LRRRFLSLLFKVYLSENALFAFLDYALQITSNNNHLSYEIVDFVDIRIITTYIVMILWSVMGLSCYTPFVSP
jgi:hypothetical protein